MTLWRLVPLFFFSCSIPIPNAKSAAIACEGIGDCSEKRTSIFIRVKLDNQDYLQLSGFAINFSQRNEKIHLQKASRKFCDQSL